MYPLPSLMITNDLKNRLAKRRENHKGNFPFRPQTINCDSLSPSCRLLVTPKRTETVSSRLAIYKFKPYYEIKNKRSVYSNIRSFPRDVLNFKLVNLLCTQSKKKREKRVRIKSL